MTQPSIEQKLLAVIRAARKKLEPCREHGVGLGRGGVLELDRLLQGGERELTGVLEQTPRLLPSDRLTIQP